MLKVSGTDKNLFHLPLNWEESLLTSQNLNFLLNKIETVYFGTVSKLGKRKSRDTVFYRYNITVSQRGFECVQFSILLYCVIAPFMSPLGTEQSFQVPAERIRFNQEKKHCFLPTIYPLTQLQQCFLFPNLPKSHNFYSVFFFLIYQITQLLQCFLFPNLPKSLNFCSVFFSS